jgi:hypothetical protein
MSSLGICPFVPPSHRSPAFIVCKGTREKGNVGAKVREVRKICDGNRKKKKSES